MDFSSRLRELFSSVEECTYSLATKKTDEFQAMDYARKLLQQANIVYVIGNGGSAGIASHFSNDLMKGLKIASQTLYDTNLMTCLSNDIGYDQVFSYPLERLLKPRDLLVAISSSGKSPNIIKAVQIAQARKVPIITLSGFSPQNPLRTMGQLNFWIDRSDYGLVETAHFFLLHTIIDTWNKNSSPTAQYAEILRHAK